MREIKFRGKSTNPNHEWVYGDLIHRLDGSPIIRHNLHTEIKHGDEVTVWQEDTVKTKTVGQFTGLHDKNGKEIYEGDIIQGEYNHSYLIRYSEDEAMFTGTLVEYVGNKYAERSNTGEVKQKWIDEFNKIVIGNIHDDPELLKGGEKCSQS